MMTFEVGTPGLRMTWWLPVIRTTLKPARSNARRTCLLLTPANRRAATSSRYADGTNQWNNVGRNFVALIAANLERQLNSLARHAQRLVFVLAIRDDLGQRGDTHRKAAFRLGPQLDRVANLFGHRVRILASDLGTVIRTAFNAKLETSHG